VSYGHGQGPQGRPPKYVPPTRAMPQPFQPDQRRQPDQQHQAPVDPYRAPGAPSRPDRRQPPPRGPVPPPQQGFGGPPPPRRKRRGRKIALTALLVIVALVAGLWIYLETSLTRIDALTDYEGRPAAASGTNWLVVGSDSREGLTAEDEERLSTGDAKGQRTDTIMLLHLPDNDVRPTLVSLLRDSLVDIPGKGKNKLNAAYAFGGPQLLAKTVELNTGLRLDHYMEIGFGGFADVVDAVGGVEMCLDAPINDPLAGINLPAGCQELDGKNALGYVRTRKGPRADLDRVIRQRAFIGALTKKATSAGTLVNPFRLFPLLGSAPDAITVDDDTHLHNLPPVALAMGGASDGNLITTTIPMGGSQNVKGVGSAILWDKVKAPKLFEALKNDTEVPDEVIVGPGG